MVGMVAGALVVVMASAVPIVLVPNQVAHDVAETHSGVQLVRNGRSMLVPPTIRDRIQGLSRPAPALVVNAVSLMSAVIVPVRGSSSRLVVLAQQTFPEPPRLSLFPRRRPRAIGTIRVLFQLRERLHRPWTSCAGGTHALQLAVAAPDIRWGLMCGGHNGGPLSPGTAALSHTSGMGHTSLVTHHYR
eukprot:CAMPEP_0206308604 /NCGR_PEP_ID=MMETSP0106_2-20121207/11950_1 /ASSEMBLY_ACC=CAM_ASM_000206 /TAXON_ID=81532 /ORGANISM="Acanthoeca-like sp., Strain 10tr" /LENGTH=187 /DNA_ID=CAMNT_0053739659 /DNA_START=834 /DNA_END=1395 /DNA_ORIENTATION=+